MGKDYYEILGVSSNATPEAIKKAYRKKVLAFHPDAKSSDPDAEKKFKEATQAYKVLSNPEERQKYDRYGDAGVQGGGGFSYQNVDLDDILKNFGFQGSFGMNFGRRGGRQQNSHSAVGESIRVVYRVTLSEIAKGIDKKIKIKRFETCKDCGGNGAKEGSHIRVCPDCDGTGQDKKRQGGGFFQMFFSQPCSGCKGRGKSIKTPCNTCDGKGRRQIEDFIDLHFPPGITTEVEYSITGKGNAPEGGGVPGDLIVYLEQKKDSFFKRSGSHLHCNYYVSFVDAVLGGSIEVPTLEKKVKLKVPAGTQSGTIFKLKGKGLPSWPESGRVGDQFVRLHVWIPKNITPSEAKKIEALRQIKGVDPEDKKESPSFFERLSRFF